MFAIGPFAQLAKVSARTLRHYDEVGLFRPAHVDARTGYRHYRADQLPDLNRILVLKDLGFSLVEITRMTEAGVSGEELLGMLRLRRAEAERRVEAERRRLDRMAARIELIQEEATMPDHPTLDAIVVKALDGHHVATATEPVDGFDDDFAPVFERLYGNLFGALAEAGVEQTGPHLAYYTERSDGRVDVVAAVPVPPTVTSADIGHPDVEVRDLPPVERGATLVHLGPMADCDRSYQALERWIDDAGETAVGYSREIYLDCSGGPDTWVTELQFALA